MIKVKRFLKRLLYRIGFDEEYFTTIKAIKIERSLASKGWSREVKKADWGEYVEYKSPITTR
jgi:hypothetical protein